MKRLALAVAALGFVALGARPAVAQEMEMKMAEGEAVEFTAQVVDLSCKVVFGLTGEEHRMCAQVCADKGIPLVLLHEGEIYLPVDKAMPGTGSNEQLKPHAEQEVKVKGNVIQRGGLKTIIIESVEVI